MGLLSNISGKEVVAIFQKFGYTLDHQTGSHIYSDIPRHNRMPFSTHCHNLCNVRHVPNVIVLLCQE